MKFYYEAMDGTGKVIKGELESTSSEAAIGKMRAMGLFPTKIRKAKATMKDRIGYTVSRKKKSKEVLTAAGAVIIASVVTIIALSCVIGCFFGSGFGWLALFIVGLFVTNKYILVFRKITGRLSQPKLCQCDTKCETTEGEN